jgi:hypothetical protein
VIKIHRWGGRFWGTASELIPLQIKINSDERCDEADRDFIANTASTHKAADK